MANAVAEKTAVKSKKWDNDSILAMCKDPDVKKMMELFPAYDNADVANDLLSLARLAREDSQQEAARIASTALVRVLPLVEREIRRKRQWVGTAWLDGLVVARGFAAVIHLLLQVGVLSWAGG